MDITDRCTIDSQPRAEAPEVSQDIVTFQCLGLSISGSVRMGAGGPRSLKPALPAQRSPVGMGWRAGWVQVNVQEWCWALYRAGHDKATLKEWPAYTLLDTDQGDGRDVFCSLRAPMYQVLSPVGTASVQFADKPIQQFARTLGAGEGGGELSAIGVRFSFVCALAARAPDDALYLFGYVPWFVEWSYDFEETTAGLVPKPLARHCRAAAGPVGVGTPRVLMQSLSGLSGRSANSAAATTPATRSLKGAEIAATLARLRG